MRLICSDSKNAFPYCPYCLEKNKAQTNIADLPALGDLQPKACLLCGSKDWASSPDAIGGLLPCRSYRITIGRKKFSYCVSLSICNLCFKAHIIRPELETRCPECNNRFRVRWPMNMRCVKSHFEPLPNWQMRGESS